MRYEIVLSPHAVNDLRNLRAYERSKVKSALEAYLRQEPTKSSKKRIKRLRGVSRPQYRLRVDEIRVFYDVEDDAVEVLAIVPKSRAQEWLEEAGESDEGDSSI